MTTEQQQGLTLRDHLEELRRRLFIAALASVVGTVVTFIFHRQILLFLQRPAADLPGITGAPLIFTEATEMIGITMKVSFLGGIILALPVLTYQVVMFVSPGLTPKERKYLLFLLPGVSLAFVLGIAFGYFVLIPPAFRFLLTFNSDIAAPMIRIGNYINLIVNLLFWMGLVFEAPILMFTLAKLRVVSHKTFAKWRRLSFVLAFVLGALITPTFDPINQTLVALPIIVLYETGVWLAWLARRDTSTVSDAVPESGG